MRQKAKALCLGLLTVSVLVAAVTVQASPPDVVGTKYEEAVEGLMSLEKDGHQVITGAPDGSFNPDKTLTRAEAATILVRASGQGRLADTLKGQQRFPDVPGRHWAVGYIAAAAENGWVTGYPSGEFGYENPVTYDQWLAMLVRVLGYDEAAREQGWPDGYRNIAAQLGLLDNTNYSQALGAQPISRGEVAVAAYNALFIAVPAEQTTTLAASVFSTTEPTVADGVLYGEDFEDGAALGWQLGSNWEIVEESSGNRAIKGSGHHWASYTDDSWSEYGLKLRVRILSGVVHINYRQTESTRYFVGFGTNEVYLNKTIRSGSEVTHPQLGQVSEWHDPSNWHDLEIKGEGGDLHVYVNGRLVLSCVDPEPVSCGGIAFETLESSEAYIDDIEVIGLMSREDPLRWVKTGGPIGGLGYDVRMRPDNPQIMYVTDTWSGVSKSSNGGQTWYGSNQGITSRAGPSGDAVPIFSLTIDPHNHDVIWAGTQNDRGIFRSDDGGSTWREWNNGVVEYEGIAFRGFTVHPNDPNTVYAAAEVSSFVWAGQVRQGVEFDMTQGVVYRTTDAGKQWTAVWRGDNLARYIFINPDDPDIIYVSTGIFDREAANSVPASLDGGGVGVLKSFDGGDTWQALGRANGLNNLYIGSLYMHPSDPDILLAGAGHNVYREGSGVYLTTNGGQTWAQTLSTASEPITSVEFADSDPSIAYAGGASAFYRSEDGGQTWGLISGGPPDYKWGPAGIRAGVPIDFQVDPGNANRIFVNNYGGGNFLSEDGGRTWTVASRGYTGAQLHSIAVDPRNPKCVYTIGRSGIFYSTDGGNEWRGLNTAPASYPEWYTVVVNPADPDVIMVSDEHQGALLRSGDGGDQWQLVFDHPGAEPYPVDRRGGYKAIAYAPSNPSVVYAGMCGSGLDAASAAEGRHFGIHKSVDGGRTWAEANDQTTADQNVSVIAVDPRDHQVVYAGTVNAGVFKSSDGGQNWRQVNQGLGVLDVRSLAIDAANPLVVYAGTERGGIYKSVDGGESWKYSGSGMDAGGSVRAIVADPTRPGTIYAAELHTGVYHSEDNGRTWERIVAGLSTRAVKDLAISNDGSTLYAATEGEGVFRLDLRPSQGR